MKLQLFRNTPPRGPVVPDVTTAPAPITIGILGVGKLGTALGRLVLDAGYDLVLAGRPAAQDDLMLGLIVSSLLPEARLTDFATLAAAARVTILAVPRPALAEVDLGALRGIIVDATNAWEATDGAPPDTGAGGQSEGGGGFAALAAAHPHLSFVRALNHAAYTDLGADARPAGVPGRRALGVAGGAPAVDAIAGLVDAFGFDPVVLDAEQAHLLDVDGPVFGRRLERAEFEAAVGIPGGRAVDERTSGDGYIVRGVPSV